MTAQEQLDALRFLLEVRREGYERSRKQCDESDHPVALAQWTETDWTLRALDRLAKP